MYRLGGRKVNMSATTKHHVTIKGVKDGLVFLLDDVCEWQRIASGTAAQAGEDARANFDRTDHPCIR